jgi:RHH-type rel operon transcriptional repressor/antitoxin RelB
MPLSVRLDEEVEKELKEAASALGRSQAWIVREAVRYYLDELADLEVAMERLKDPRAQWIDHEDVKRELGLED